jgi:hypothetical protein
MHPEHGDQAQREEILRELLADGQIQGPAAGVTRQLLARGENSLSDRQEWVFSTQVREKYIDRICELCEQRIPVSEVRESWSNGGYCGICARILGKSGDGGESTNGNETPT